MRGRHSTGAIPLHEHTRLILRRWLRSQTTPVGLTRRARALLLLEQGHTYVATAKLVGRAE
jgi:hypothetical protein